MFLILLSSLSLPLPFLHPPTLCVAPEEVAFFAVDSTRAEGEGVETEIIPPSYSAHADTSTHCNHDTCSSGPGKSYNYKYQHSIENEHE